jgi:hypothetical protein
MVFPRSGAAASCPLFPRMRTSRTAIARSACANSRHYQPDDQATAVSRRILTRGLCDPGVACDRTKEPPLIREAACASLKAPLRPVPAQVDPTDASKEREGSGW